MQLFIVRLQLLLLLCAAASAQQSANGSYPNQPDTAETYITRGSMDFAIGGYANIPHADSSATGSGSVGLGYYLSDKHLVGGSVGVSSGLNSTSYSLTAHYRRLFPTANPRVFPFVGGFPGLAMGRAAGASSNVFTARGEAGVKYFVAPNVAVETAYNLAYHRSSGISFGRSSASGIVLGLSFTFAH